MSRRGRLPLGLERVLETLAHLEDPSLLPPAPNHLYPYGQSVLEPARQGQSRKPGEV